MIRKHGLIKKILNFPVVPGYKEREFCVKETRTQTSIKQIEHQKSLLM